VGRKKKGTTVKGGSGGEKPYRKDSWKEKWVYPPEALPVNDSKNGVNIGVQVKNAKGEAAVVGRLDGAES